MEKPKKKRIKLKITKSIPELTETNIETIFNENFKDVSILLDDDNYNTFLNKKELLNRRVIFEN